MILPNKTSGWRSRILNAIIDCIRAREVVDSGDIVAKRTPAGTYLRLRDKTPDRLGFPYGSDTFMWGVDVTGDGTSLYVGEGLYYEWWEWAGTICSAATVGPFTAATQYVVVSLTARLAPFIDTTPDSLANPWKLYGDNFVDYPPRIPLYKVTSIERDGTYYIDKVIPYHVGPIYTHIPYATTADDGKKLTWVHPVNTDWT